jgi:hypothetical protein
VGVEAHGSEPAIVQLAIFEADAAVLMRHVLLVVVVVPIALIVHAPLMPGGDACLARPTLASGGLGFLRFDEVFDVEGSPEELGEALEVQVQVQGEDLPLLLPQDCLPGRPLVLQLLILRSLWVLRLPQGLKLLAKFGGLIFVSVQV